MKPMPYHLTDKALASFLIQKHFTIKQAMRQIGENTGRVLYVVDEEDTLFGSLSDGDIRKWIVSEGSLSATVEEVCFRSPTYVNESYDIEDVKELMLGRKIESIPVLKPSREIAEILLWDKVFGNDVPRHRETVDTQVVIMAGGKGTRLDPFTKILPKPLIPINGKPIIEIIMDKFGEYGIKEFYLCLNHKSRMIKSYFEEMDDKPRRDIYYAVEEKELGTVGGLKLITQDLREPFLVTNCDILIQTNYSDIIHFHKEKQNDLTMVVSCRHYVIPYGVCEIQNGGTLKSMTEKPEYDLWVNTGMYVMNKNLLELIPASRRFSINELIEVVRKNNRRLGLFPINEKSWIDIGQWEEYHKALSQIKV
jgi:dTDP-glucose pyrophosphorylase